jgi:predicted ATPase
LLVGSTGSGKTPLGGELERRAEALAGVVAAERVVYLQAEAAYETLAAITREGEGGVP